MPGTLYHAVNPHTRITTEISQDTETGLPLILRQTQDVRAILDQNQRDAAGFDRARVARNPAGFRHIGRIPWVVFAQLRQLGIVKGMQVVDEKRFLQFLSDHQVRKLRTDDGRRLA